MLCESVVAAVVRRNGHDSPRAIARQHVVADIDRYLRPVERIDRIGSGELSAHALRVGHALALGAFFRLLDIALDRLALLRRGDLTDQRVLRGEHHESGPENRIGPRREHLELLVEALQSEEYLRALAAPDPVALDLLERVAPFEGVEPVEHPLGISRHAQQPLLHPLLHDRIAAPHRQAVLHLVVREHGSQFGTPVHERVGAECETVVLQHALALGLVHRFPPGSRERKLLGARHVQSLGSRSVERLDEPLDRHGPVLVITIVAAEHFQKGPLRPMVIFRVAGTHLAIPVETETDLVELFAVTRDVALGRDGRMLARLDRVLLGRQPEGIVSHRVQHVETLQPLVARIDVRSDVAERMSDVQTRPRRIGEHVQYVVFRARGVFLHPVSSALGPAFLPFLLNFPEVVFHRSLVYCCLLFIIAS